jgi:hypothetical protein
MALSCYSISETLIKTTKISFRIVDHLVEIKFGAFGTRRRRKIRYAATSCACQKAVAIYVDSGYDPKPSTDG